MTSVGLRIIPLPTAKLSENGYEICRRWASAYGATARQRTVKQEMSEHRTLPDFVLCQRQLDVGERVTLNFGFDENEDVNEDHESNQSEDVSDYNIMKTAISIKAAMKRVGLIVTVDRTSEDPYLRDKLGGGGRNQPISCLVPGHDYPASRRLRSSWISREEEGTFASRLDFPC